MLDIQNVKNKYSHLKTFNLLVNLYVFISLYLTVNQLIVFFY
jgi:hypothetical protein